MVVFIELMALCVMILVLFMTFGTLCFLVLCCWKSKENGMVLIEAVGLA